MKKEFKGPGRKSGNGKGKEPIKGYNYKKWYSNFDLIKWKKDDADGAHNKP